MMIKTIDTENITTELIECAYMRFTAKPSKKDIQSLLEAAPAVEPARKCHKCGHDWHADSCVNVAPEQEPAQAVPVARIVTIGGYPDDSQHTIEWLVKHKDLHDGQLLYTRPAPLAEVTPTKEGKHEQAQAVPVDSDTRKVVEASIKVKLGNEYGDDIAGLWFWLLPADEYAEQAIIKRLEAGNEH